MRALSRHALGSLMIVAASNVSAGVITQDGVVFTSTYVGNVLTLEIDAAKRSGGWAAASAIDALSLKTIGSFSGVTMRSSLGTNWSLASSELNARGCAVPKGKSTAASMTRLCYTGAGIALADDMVFTFTFTGTPVLSAPHLKVHFVDANGIKKGSLLSLDFPWQAAETPLGSQRGSAGSTGLTSSTGSPGGQTGHMVPVAELIPTPVGAPPAAQAGVSNKGGSGDLAHNKNASEVPEPRTLGLMTAGLIMLAVARRRRK